MFHYTFDITTLANNCTETYKDNCPFFSVPISVSNTGNKTASDFVTLGFISGQFGPAPHPIKRLVAYQRSFDVKPGTNQTAYLNLTMGSLGRHDDMGNLVLYPGDYSLLVDVPTRAMWNFTMTGEQFVLENWPQRPASM